MIERVFANRREAGRVLAQRLERCRQWPRRLVLALPRGGVPVAYEVANALEAPLDVVLVRKLGVPGQEELAMGALASGGRRVLNHEVLEAHQIPMTLVESVTAREQAELWRREQLYRNQRPPLDVRDKTVFLVDDGLATGATMRAAIAALRQMVPAALIVAVPVAAPQTCEALRRMVDVMVCAMTPEPLEGVGKWYDDFAPVSDDEVLALLGHPQPEPQARW